MNRFACSQIQWSTIILLVLSLLVAGFVGSSRPALSAPSGVTRYVATTGNDYGNNCTIPAQPCRKIQYAVDIAVSGDVISIGSGPYIENVIVDEKSLTLQGQGAAATIVNGNESGSVLIVSSGSVIVSKLTLQNGSSSLGGGMSIASGVVATVSDSNIVDNKANQVGAGIYNQGRLNLVNVLLRNNQGNAASTTTGGGIFNAGEANLNNVTLFGNTATIGGGIGNINIITLTNSIVGSPISTNQNKSTNGNGGGIYGAGVSSQVTLINSSVVGNRAEIGNGGGVYNSNILIASNTVITGNFATYSGGGIYSDSSGQMTLSGGVVQTNTASLQNGGGVYNAGAAVIDNVLFNINRAAASGGGLFNATGGKLSIDSTTVSNNTTSSFPGGGINSQGILTLTKSAVIYNVANSAQGGGLYITGTARLNNVTLSDNTATAGGGLLNEGSSLKISFSTIFSNSGASAIRNTGSTVVISSSILAQSSGSGVCQGAFTTGGYNIDRGTSCGLTSPSDLQNTDPKLKPLQNNGGASPTRAVDFSSKAVDSIPPNVCSLNVDQRGVARPTGLGCDRGAYEIAGYSTVVGQGFLSGECVTSTIPISANLAIGQVLVGVNVSATQRSQLGVTFISPSNRRVTLLSTGQSSGANLSTLFDDTAGFFPLSEDQPSDPLSYATTYRPDAPLSQMNGLAIRGTWKLQVCSIGTSGTFNRWTIIVPELTNFKVRLPLIRK